MLLKRRERGTAISSNQYRQPGWEQADTILRFVALSSKTGRYGGPADSAFRQSQIASTFVRSIFLSGFLANDQPDLEQTPGLTVVLYKCAPLMRRLGFITLFSWAGIANAWKTMASVHQVHVSIAREIMPITVAAIALIRHRRLILQPHGMLTGDLGFRQKLVDRLVKPIVKRSAVVVALTETEARDLHGWLGDGRNPPISILYNPIIGRLSPARPQENHGNEALFIGRLHARKRLDVLVNAAMIATSNKWNDSYVVIGPDEGELKLVRRSPSVRYEGCLPRQDIANRVAQCCVFVLPSSREPWGNVVALALSLGKPIIISESAAISSIIDQYRAGLLVPDGDTNALALAIHSVLTDDKLKLELIQGAKKLATQRFSYTEQLLRLNTLYGLTGRRTSPSMQETDTH